ncbi:NAD-dependent epimerase/dehydratase family protein [Streptomyces sp. NPDC051976]|uniref:NAD-dependent epimerase/dehydratase family protein n=1 Tax=Streptomyces sp. NPDC051976 TaxID=3154947 RepID=UPI003433A73B
MSRPTLLVTGGLGALASVLNPALRESYDMRIATLAPTADAEDELVLGDLLDPAVMDRATRGVDAILHLAAMASPRAGWDEIAKNVAITASLLDSAQRHGVGRIVLASSNHAAGLNYRDGEFPVAPQALPRPCCAYGAGKIAAEALGRLHAERTGATVISLRFGLVGWPLAERDYNAMWLSDHDARALVAGALVTTVRHGIYFGVSRHGSRYWDIGNATSDLGYRPRDPLPAGAANLPWAHDTPCLMFPPRGTTASGPHPSSDTT